MNKSYKVLARKYRPSNFTEVKGQEVLVQTVSNAIKMNRVPNAFLLTGIRGIGKTTIARIIAKTLNCLNLDLKQDIIIPCNECQNCLTFNAEKHPDIIEIDAASKTGINDIREIIENCRYLPQMSKYKIYVIDEVHMLSINAFNALLKTLEEPPVHVIFIFATTEVKKIPITIISRCQRFDLRRLKHNEIIEHLKNILIKEEFSAEDKTLEIIAKCSEGSVRDSLSLLDRAIMYSCDGKIQNNQIIEILGIGDKSEILELLYNVISSDVNLSLEILNKIYFKGIDPIFIINEFTELINILTKIKVTNNTSLCYSYIFTEEDNEKLIKIANLISISYLTSFWETCIKSINELEYTENALRTAEMFIIKASFIEKETKTIIDNCSNKINIKNIKQEEKTEIRIDNSNQTKQEETKTQDHDHTKISNFSELAQLFYDNKEMIIYHHLIEDVHLVKFEPRILKIRQKSNVPHNFVNQVSKMLTEWTNHKWVVTLSHEAGEASIAELNDIKKQVEINEISENKIIKDIVKEFSGAKITNITKKETIFIE